MSKTSQKGNKTEATPTTIHMNRRTGEFSLTLSLDHQSIIDAAKQIIARRFKRHSVMLNKVDKLKDFLLLNMATFEREVFACLFLDNDHRLIHFEPLFYGSINSAHINPREVIKQALAHNAAAMIVAHYVARYIMGIMLPTLLCSLDHLCSQNIDDLRI